MAKRKPKQTLAMLRRKAKAYDALVAAAAKAPAYLVQYPIPKDDYIFFEQNDAEESTHDYPEGSCDVYPLVAIDVKEFNNG